MPLPNPSHRGQTGRPPSRDELREGNEAAGATPPAQSYDQSASMPSDDLGPGETAAPARPIGRGRVEDEHDTIEDLADEPIMETSDSDTDNGSTRGEHFDADSDLLESLGDAPQDAEDEND